MFYVDSEKAMEDAIAITRKMSRNTQDCEFDICFPNQKMCHLFMNESVKNLRKQMQETRSNLKINIHVGKQKSSDPY
ncbi:hypothetical protein H8D29_03645 [PVC group bacterium]|nr:hypothetical protein [PVC group bacterium]